MEKKILNRFFYNSIDITMLTKTKIFILTSLALSIVIIQMSIFTGCSNKNKNFHSLRRIAILEDARTLGGGDLNGFITHQSPEVRERAVLAAGRIRDLQIIPALLKCLKDENEDVRLETIFALGQLGDSSAVSGLIDHFKTGASEEKWVIIEALGKIKSVAAVDFLRKQAESGKDELKTKALYSLTSQKDKEIFAHIEDFLTSENFLVRRAAAYAGYRMADSTTQNKFVSALNDSDEYVRKYAAGAIGRLKKAEYAKYLIPLLKDVDLGVRVQAIRALGRCGSELPLKQLLELADDPNYQIYRESLDALGNLKIQSAPEKLIKMLKTAPKIKIPFLIESLTKIEGDRFLPFLDTYSDYPDAPIRRSVGQSLAYLKEKNYLILASDMMKDTDPTVRTAVVLGILEKGKEAKPIFEQALNDSDWAVRTVAVEAFKNIGDTGYFVRLSELFVNHLNRTEAEETRTVMDALFSLDRTKALPLIRKGLNSPQPSVVKKAEELLSKAGEEVPVRPAPKDSDYPEDFGKPMEKSFITLIISKGRIEIELYEKDAPVIAANIIKLVRNGFYENTVFQRVVPDFVAQGGDPRGDGWGGPGYTIRDQINRKKFVKGAVGLPISELDTGSCQIFICLSDQTHLDGKYTVFGKVVKGMEILPLIEQGEMITDITVSIKSDTDVKFKEL